MDKYQFFYKKASEILDDVKENITFYAPEKSLSLLTEASDKFLKTIIYFYEIVSDEYMLGSINLEELINLIEENTTIKIPPFKDLIIDLENSFCEGGCSSPILYKNLPTYYIQAVEDLKSFVIDEIGLWNLEE